MFWKNMEKVRWKNYLRKKGSMIIKALENLDNLSFSQLISRDYSYMVLLLEIKASI